MLAEGVSGNPTQLYSLDGPGARKVTGRSLFGMDRTALSALLVEMGEPAWRGRQVAEAIYVQRHKSLDAITTLPKTLRERLAGQGWEIGRPEILQVFRSVDGTERYLVGRDTDTVGTVWMPEGDEGE